ncbi:chloride channel protein [Rubellicoccus peritrichatus]|uniref:Chloride channel protein n=1 Tax=Rubellicoccus peritrichatus TaxID=3080537 RepID=A0AAQ3L6C1_9BACT|nr:chloride channel protein [Puniceicoccus sp. CR14]WOO39507.1 chloride channel protein [Puniceicoccus sp. CR14]
MANDLPEDSPTWKDSVFSMRAWHGYVVFFIGAVCSGLGALFFAVMDRYSGNLLDWMGGSARYLVFLIIPGGLTLIIWLRDKYFHGTDGTGIPQTIAALKMGECPARGGCLSMRIAIGKIILTTMGLFSFLSMGREGPSVQLGACFMHLTTKFHKFPQHLVQRGLILGGGAAGIAAAFNAPVAGIVFSMEEIGRSFDKRSMGTIVRTVILACIVCVFGLGNYFFYGDINAGRNPLQFTNLLQWASVIIVGVVGGLLGGLFSTVLLWTTPKIARLLKTHKIQTAVVIGLLIALISLISGGASLGSGYDEARAIILNGSPDYVETLSLEDQQRLQRDHEKVTPMYPVYRAAATFLVLITSIPGGLFDPSFSVGAGIGQYLAPLFAWTGVGTQGIVLLFIVSYFSGVVQSPMTSFIILIEMTGAVMFALPLGFAAIIAYEMSRLVCPNALYEALAEKFLAASSCQNESGGKTKH